MVQVGLCPGAEQARQCITEQCHLSKLESSPWPDSLHQAAGPNLGEPSREVGSHPCTSPATHSCRPEKATLAWRVQPSLQTLLGEPGTPHPLLRWA